MSAAVRRAAPRLVMVGWLLLVWVLLWGRTDAAVLAGGLAMAAVTYRATRLPHLPVLLRLRLRATAWSVLHFCYDLVLSSLIIAWHAVYRPHRVRGALLRIEFRSRSDPLLVLLTDSLSLRPGTLVVDIDRSASTVLVHAMPVADRAQAEKQRGDALAEERRLIRAFGTPHDVAALETARPDDEREE